MNDGGPEAPGGLGLAVGTWTGPTVDDGVGVDRRFVVGMQPLARSAAMTAVAAVAAADRRIDPILRRVRDSRRIDSVTSDTRRHW